MAYRTATTTPVPTRTWQLELIELLPGVTLALLMCWSVVASLAQSNWAPGLEVLLPIVVPALIVGVVFARLHWLPEWLAHTLSSVLAVTWVVRMLSPLMSDQLPTWRDQATELLIRSVILGRVLQNGGRGEDILLFVAALALLCWGLGYATAWMVFRRGWLWWAVLLNAVVILVNYTYVSPKPTQLFFVFLVAALLLLVYQYVLQQQVAWAKAHVEYPDFLPLRFLWAAALVCGLLILVTSMLPGRVSSTEATRTWQTISHPFTVARERWEDVFSTISAPPGSGGGSFTSRGVSLGGARVLSDEVVMNVYSTEFEYWRAVAFDKYSSNGWQNTTGEQARAALGTSTPEQARTPLAPDAQLPLSNTRASVVITQVVDLTQDRKDDFLVVGGTAVGASIPALVEHNYVTTPEGQRVPNYDDTALIVSQSPLRSGETYTMTALVSKADVQSLRQSGTDYPNWVRERYLQLPDTITPRTLDRARTLVSEAGATNPYDQAIAIQSFLRTLPYNENIPRPPSGAEPVDYFLFDLRQGYCDYYASSMVVMLRSLGVPARWVQGYAGGLFDPELGGYVVRENVAHSWPEIFFPGYGWERFEPTPASYTALPRRPLTSAFGADASEDGLVPDSIMPSDPGFTDELDEGLESVGTQGAQTPGQFAGGQMQRGLAVLASVLAVLGLVVLGFALRWRYALRGLSHAAANYASMELLARWSGLGQPPHTTPYEYGATLSAAVPEQRRIIDTVTETYVAERYRGAKRSVRPPSADEIRDLRLALVRQIFLRPRNRR